MMTEGTARIKQEIDISCCSPSPSSNSNAQSLLYNSSDGNVSPHTLSCDMGCNAFHFQIEYKCNPDTLITERNSSPGSPDRQFCSSTTSALGEFVADSVCQDITKEELPR